MTTSLTFEDVLSEIYLLDVRVKEGKLIIKKGGSVSPMVMVAIKHYAKQLFVYYSDPALLQVEMEELEKKIALEEKTLERYTTPEDKDSRSELISSLWKRYYDILYLRSRNMIKPWVKIKEDEQRCPRCPDLGKPAINGILCIHGCKMRG